MTHLASSIFFGAAFMLAGAALTTTVWTYRREIALALMNELGRGR